ncbi:acyl dehydratase [Pseudarthrobacter sulfonivorans]|uniref:Acyl dehydratase n=1 Tax=Pseudarthrobacter sulfonivorans TaxID=121292 RepID=A0A0U3NSP2_9MICC|nr:MaoC/PaaZ C-terminal domain-containing protein [Pseudarthrobacter sulfonivorans]ALV39855.1 acyl dehydratase [Pseudarthrobacter sulfonivorans]
MISKPYEDIKTGDTATTNSRIITGEYVRAFGELTGDNHPLHTNAQYAEQTRFGKQIAHGALMISTLLGLVELHPSYLQCFYSLDNLRFKAPSYFGDSVYAVCEILAVTPHKDGESAVVTSAAKLINQDGVTVLSGDFSLLVAGRSTALADPALKAQGAP